MTPVTQTRVGWPMGNCWEACIASILECDLADVPDGRLAEGGYDQEQNYQQVKEWCVTKHRRLLVWLSEDYSLRTIPAGVDVILSVLTTDEYERLPHAVVARDGTVVHNPHPGRSGWGWRGIAGVIGSEILLPVSFGVERPWMTDEWVALGLPPIDDAVLAAARGRVASQEDVDDE